MLNSLLLLDSFLSSLNLAHGSLSLPVSLNHSCVDRGLRSTTGESIASKSVCSRLALLDLLGERKRKGKRGNLVLEAAERFSSDVAVGKSEDLVVRAREQKIGIDPDLQIPRDVDSITLQELLNNFSDTAHLGLLVESLSFQLRVDDVTCGSPRWIGRGFSCVCMKRKVVYERVCVNLTPSQEERLNRLKHRMNVYFDPSRHGHQEALRALWASTYPDQELHGLISEQWKQMGWQGKDPSTDFRGGGFISLENLLFFAKTFSGSFQRLLNKQGGNRAAWEYPFAVAGVNITFMIMQMLDLHSSKPRRFVRTVFIQMLAEDEWAFDLLYCVAFMVMDKQWLERNASYMEFNEVLRSTRVQLEKELLLDDVMRIEDMPSYGLLS
ncbi:hypothetical protein KFK09_026945 [Dendrobium nobile]|uniref:ELMO domain-containing protein n=1 Tax=Dendrobium nobile TaxID=94219 RepID=A0A8T3A974_DENNO|nr:hypothetical protein KFK09_026945 [Dendrobium nobile]